MANSSEKKPATRRYHPYQYLQVPIRTLYELPTSPEYLFDEEAVVQCRSWSENLQYYTGSGYLASTVTSCLKGSLEGLRAAEPGETLKLRTNRVLNSGGHIGMKFGNTLGFLGLIFAGLESGILHFRGTDDVLNSVAAGLGTGVLYCATAGPRSAAIAEAIRGLAIGEVVVCAIKAPGFGENRKANLQDLATLTGGTVITDELGMNLEKVGLEVFGSCKKVYNIKE